MTSSIYKKFRRNTIILVLIISLTPFLFLGGIIFYEFSLIYQNKVEEQIKFRARVQANAIDFFLQERTAVLSSIADLYSLETLVQGHELTRIFEIMNRRTGGFVDLGIIDQQGQHIAYVGPYDLQGLNYYQQPWFAEVMSKGLYISDVYMGYRQIPHFIIAVRRQENNNTWILRATIDSDIFNVLVRRARVGQTGDAFIINHEGIYQTTPRFGAQILTDSELDPRLFGEGAVIEKLTPEGKKILYAGSWLQDKDWLLVVQQDIEEGMVGLLKTRNAWMTYIGLGCVAILLITIFTVRLTVSNLEKASLRKDEVDLQILQEDKMAALGKMAAGIAHEINNPLAVIGEKTGWMMDLLEDEQFKNSPNYEEYKQALQKIEMHVERVRKVIYNMLSYARKMEPKLEDVDVNEVIRQTIEFVGNVARINNTKIETQLGENLPIIAADQGKLQQVFLNIISNAIDAAGKNGLIQIKTSTQNSKINIEIKDNGPGIPRELQKKIFEPFFTTKASGKGTGMGLWICFNIVENMGGNISLESEPGKGAAFTISLPVVQPEKK